MIKRFKEFTKQGWEVQVTADWDKAQGKFYMTVFWEDKVPRPLPAGATENVLFCNILDEGFQKEDSTSTLRLQNILASYGVKSPKNFWQDLGKLNDGSIYTKNDPILPSDFGEMDEYPYGTINKPG